MTTEELAQLMLQPEGIKLDFKREYHLTKATNSPEWRKMVQGQWNELIKDVLALTNGNVGTSQQTAYLVIGMGDKRDANGLREVFDTNHIELTEQNLMGRLNKVSTPPLSDIRVESVDVDGKIVKVVVLPPSPHVHETNSELDTYKGEFDKDGNLRHIYPGTTYTAFTIFVRNSENISPASFRVSKALEEDKGFALSAMNDNLRFELANNLTEMIIKTEKGNLCRRSILFENFHSRTQIKFNEDLVINQKDALNLFWATLYATGCAPKISTQFLEAAISSGIYLGYNFSQGTYERGLFLQRLHELQSNIKFFRNAESNFKFGEFAAKYIEPNRTEGTTKIAFFDALIVVGLLSRHENMTRLSVALLSFLMGDEDALTDVPLNPTLPLILAKKTDAQENPTSQEISEWIASGGR